MTSTAVPTAKKAPRRRAPALPPPPAQPAWLPGTPAEVQPAPSLPSPALPQAARFLAPAWPSLEGLGLSPAARAARARFIGGSDANVIFLGSDERVLRLWREKRGEEAPEDLSGNLAVMLGSWSEAFNRQWYERATGMRVTRVSDQVTCPLHGWRGVTLDGYLDHEGAVWEAKHTNAFTKSDEALARYMPQLQHAMAVTGSQCAVLSVIFGNAKWEVFEVAADWLYQEDLLEAEQAFWRWVETGEAPSTLPPPPVPKPVGVREVCLEGSNAWAAAAADWLSHREAARSHQAAATTIKALVEPDVARAFGHGIEAKRSKAGALTIKELQA
ncbi:YqaJ viral recombinase family protein [Tsuneonella deserti]|nr:YqaJ viral recombinase family protein [Tsuneonella deserti]